MNSSAIQTRAIREVTQGVLPATAMTVFPWATLPFKSGFTRGAPDDVASHGQADDNPAEDLNITASGAGDYRITLRDQLREEVFRNTYTAGITVTSALISAVAAGNKLVRAAGWGSRAPGDLIWVPGFVTNPAAFAARVSAVSGTDLTLSWPTLVDEAAGPTVTVADLGQLIFGTSLLTSYWEEWNTKTSKGRKFPGVGATQWDLEMQFPKHFKESFQFMGMTAATRLSAQLANATTAAAVRRIVNANTNFGDKTVTNSNMGFRHAGSLLANIILKTLKLSVVSPKQTEGGAGTLGPQTIGLDGQVAVKLDITALRTGTDIDTLMDASVDPNAENSIGFGLRDPDGKRSYIYLPRMQPFNGDPDGLKKSGSEQVSLSWVGRYDSVDSAIRYANLT